MQTGTGTGTGAIRGSQQRCRSTQNQKTSQVALLCKELNLQAKKSGKMVDFGEVQNFPFCAISISFSCKFNSLQTQRLRHLALNMNA